MLKSLRVKYQSHRDTLIHFSPRVTAIFGESLHGKTAMLRGFNWLRKNRPFVTRFIPYFDDHARVQADFDNGTAIHEKGDKPASYKYTVIQDGKEIVKTKYNKAVPDVVSRLINMEDINVQEQLSQHFLVRSSPPDIAKTINQITNQEKFDDWTKEINKRLSGKRSRRKYLKQEKKTKKGQLAKFDPLDEASRCYDKATLHNAEMARLEKDLSDLMETCDAIQEAVVVTQKLPLVLEAEEIISKAVEEDKKARDLTIAKADYDQLVRSTEELRRSDKAKLFEVDRLLSAAVALDVEVREKEATAADLLAIANLLGEQATLIDQANIELDAKIKEYTAALSRIKKCPTCRGPITKENIEAIKKELGR